MSEINPTAFAMQLGMTIAFLIGGGALGGYFIGARFGNPALGAIIGSTIGLVCTFVYLFTRIRALPK
jgi:hypothetical protein